MDLRLDQVGTQDGLGDGASGDGKEVLGSAVTRNALREAPLRAASFGDVSLEG